MKRHMVILLVTVFACLNAWSDAKVLNAFEGLKLPDAVATIGAQDPRVHVTFDSTVSQTGRGSVRISCDANEPVEAMFLNAELSGSDKRVLWFNARWKSEAQNNKAYLEMLVTFADGKTYFSRGLETSQVLVGTTNWQSCRIPFFLKKGDAAVSVRAGVRFEGQGTVWLDEAALTEGLPPGLLTPGSPGFSGLMGGILGGLIGIWGGVGGVLASKGKGMRFVVISGRILMLASALSSIGAFLLFQRGMSWAVCQPILYAGAICTMVMVLVLPQLSRQYYQAALERIRAMNESGDQ